MNRKATFAKRQRETDLKDRQRQKEARRAERKAQPKDGQGPQIAWDEQVHMTDTPLEEIPGGEPLPGENADDTSGSSNNSNNANRNSNPTPNS